MRVHLCLISPELQYCQTPQFVWILLNFLQYSDSHILYGWWKLQVYVGFLLRDANF